MRALRAALLVAGAPALVFAQQTAPPVQPAPSAPPVVVDRPVSGFVLDARGVLAPFGQRPTTASALGVLSADLPGPGLGGALGAHVYLPIGRRMAIGIGGEMMMAQRGRQRLDEAGEPEGPNLKARVFSLAPQLSLNFGRREGWSYISGGIGTASFETWAESDTAERPDRRVRAINYGGGARWFTAPHLAFTVDLRFYSMAAAPAETGVAERAAHRLMVISAGISVR